MQSAVTQRLRFVLAAAALVGVLAAPLRAAHAEGAPRVVILAPSHDDRLSLRVQAELRARHFEVAEEIAPEMIGRRLPPPSREQLEQAARQGDAVAAVRIVPSSAGVEVWIVDRVTGKTVLRELVTEDLRSPTGVATVALQVVELLRASLMELDAPRPPQGEVPPSPQLRRWIAPPAAPPPSTPSATTSAPRTPFVSVELGPAAVLSPGGLRPSGNLNLGVHSHPSTGLGASLVALLPIVPSIVRGAEGSTSARISALGVAFRWVFASSSSRWAGAAGAGMTLIWLHLDGTPAPGYAGTTGELVTFAAFGRAGASFAILPRLRLRADALWGLANMRPVIRFGDRVAAVWGVPFVAPTLGLELSWP